MPDLDGSSSNFPVSLDQFVIKQPFNENVTLSQQNIDSLEQANHINHMFDAIINLETHVLAGSGGGASVVTRWSSGVTSSDGDVFGSNVKLGYSTVSISMTGNTRSVTAMVPLAFGAYPFNSKGFSISHNIYMENRAGSAYTEGIWANRSWSDVQPFNSMVGWPQLFTMIRPVSGRQYEITITNLPIHTTSENLTPTFYDALNNSTANSYLVKDRPGWDGVSHDASHIVIPYANYNAAAWQMWCEGGYNVNAPSWGWVYSDRFYNGLTDGYIEFGPIINTIFNAGFISGNEVFSRYGPMIRAFGNPTQAYFYCLSIGDVQSSNYADKEVGSRAARLFRVSNLDLSEEGGSPTYSASAWSTHATAIAIWPSDIVLAKTNTKYRLKAVGTLISVEESPSPYSVWTVIASAVDTTFASGNVGFFSKALNDSNFRGITIEGPVNIVDSTARSVDIEAQLMFLSIGPESNITTESG